MRIPPNLPQFLWIMLAGALIVAGVLWLPEVIPHIGDYASYALILGIFLLFLYLMVKLMVTYLNARADGIFCVYTDVSGKGIHIFSHHVNSAGMHMFPTRDVQHYYFDLESGKSYFTRLFTHNMHPVAGRAGWEGFPSFEESVLGSEALQRSLKKFSAKTNKPLALANRIDPINDENAYHFTMSECTIEIKEFSHLADEGYWVVCTHASGSRILWRRKI